jgi:RND family efflux transporter MFP subunit
MMTLGIRRWPYLPPVVVALAAIACGAPAEHTQSRPTTPLDVRLAHAALRPLARTFEAGGVVRAQTTAQLTSRILAEVREIRVRPGDRVTRGQVIAVLDDRDLVARRNQADASLAAARNSVIAAHAGRDAADAGLVLAKAQYARMAQLRDRKSATPAELDRAAAELQIAEGNARSAAARTEEVAASVAAAEAAARAAGVAATYSTVSAPFDGLVNGTHVEPGNMASPGLPLVTIETFDRFRLDVKVDEARVRFLKPGDSVDVELEGNAESAVMKGRIFEVARAIDPSAHSFTVKVELPAGADIRSGMFARVRIPADVRDALVVPAAAVVRRGQLSFAFVVDRDSRARVRAITPGAASDDVVEVLAGLSAGEAVVVTPPASLTDATLVRVAGGKR